jgi:hypothetical protein
MVLNAVTPVWSEKEDSLDSEDTIPENKRPKIVDIICSIWFLGVVNVLFLAVVLLALSATWTGVYVSTVNQLSDSIREKTITNTRSYVLFELLPVKLYGHLILSDIVSGIISPNAGTFSIENFS